jgi:hypothetical protein
MVLRVLLHLALIVSLAGAVVPLAAQAPAAEKADCCEKMMAQSEHDGCKKEMPKTQHEEQCCATCSMGLAILIGGASLVAPPPAGDETFAAYLIARETVSQRPPVPPPRALV